MQKMKRVALSMWRRARGWWRPAVAIDLGTAWTRLADASARLRVDAPTVATERSALRSGVIVDPEAAVAVLAPLLGQVRRGVGGGVRVLAGVPSDASPVERAAREAALRASGAVAAALVPEPLAAAIGAGIDVGGPYAALVVDVGEGVTDCALVGEGRVLAAGAARIGCADFRRAVAAERGVDLEAAERMLRVEGVAVIAPLADAALAPVLALLAELSAHRACEVIETGITLTGGGAMIPGLGRRLTEKTAVETRTVARAHECVVRGVAAMLPAADALGLWR
jgi:rod shape-determining protein MreB